MLENVKKEHGIVADLELYVTDEWSEVSEEEYVSTSVKGAHKEVFQFSCRIRVFFLVFGRQHSDTARDYRRKLWPFRWPRERNSRDDVYSQPGKMCAGLHHFHSRYLLKDFLGSANHESRLNFLRHKSEK